MQMGCWWHEHVCTASIYNLQLELEIINRLAYYTSVVFCGVCIEKGVRSYVEIYKKEVKLNYNKKPS